MNSPHLSKNLDLILFSVKTKKLKKKVFFYLKGALIILNPETQKINTINKHNKKTQKIDHFDKTLLILTFLREITYYLFEFFFQPWVNFEKYALLGAACQLGK